MRTSIKALIQHEAAPGLILVAAAFLAIMVANSPLSGSYNQFLGLPISVVAGDFSIEKPMLLWINDGLMAVFFFLIGLEVKRELTEGHLSSVGQITLPAIAALAGVSMPAFLYILLNGSDPIASRGWAIPAATDIAFALGILGLFGRRVPISLKLFLLSVAIFDDITAIAIIAIFYSTDLSLVSLGLAALGLVLLFVMNRAGVSRQSPYILIGVIVWAAVLKSGVHATLAGFAVALFIPRQRDRQGASMLHAMEHNMQPWVAFLILPLFAFSNAGVNLTGVGTDDLLNTVTLGIALGLFVGNQVGILGACWIAVKMGFSKLPEASSWTQLYGVACLCGIGFTMSLFVGSLAFENLDASYLDSVKLGVLTGSLLSAIAGSYILHRSLCRESQKEVFVYVCASEKESFYCRGRPASALGVDN